MATLLEKLNARAFALCGGHYEPKTEQDAADGALMVEAVGEIARLEAENTQLHKDAERYNFIRTEHTDVYGLYRMFVWDGAAVNWFDVPHNLDRVIDVAIDMHKNQPQIDTSAERVEKSAEYVHVDEITADLCRDDPELAALIEDAKKTITADDAATCFVRLDWPEDDSRIDVVGQNGNTAEHYEVKS